MKSLWLSIWVREHIYTKYEVSLTTLVQNDGDNEEARWTKHDYVLLFG